MSDEQEVNVDIVEHVKCSETMKEVQNSISPEKRSKQNGNADKPKLLRLPLARVKHMMKTDPDCHLISQDGLFLVTKATELFIEYLSRESAKHTSVSKRKTVMRKDVDAAVDSVSHLCFLEGALD